MYEYMNVYIRTHTYKQTNLNTYTHIIHTYKHIYSNTHKSMLKNSHAYANAHTHAYIIALTRCTMCTNTIMNLLQKS